MYFFLLNPKATDKHGPEVLFLCLGFLQASAYNLPPLGRVSVKVFSAHLTIPATDIFPFREVKPYENMTAQKRVDITGDTDILRSSQGESDYW